jgi:HSP20 family molecular chaperone IbpA
LPRWLDDFEDSFSSTTSQHGLRIHEDEKNIYLEAVVAGMPSKKVDIEIEGVVTIKADNQSRKARKS